MRHLSNRWRFGPPPSKLPGVLSGGIPQIVPRFPIEYLMPGKHSGDNAASFAQLGHNHSGDMDHDREKKCVEVDMAPATSPATPAIKTSFRVAAAAATPTIKLAVEMMPSLAPSTAALNHPMRLTRWLSGCRRRRLMWIAIRSSSRRSALCLPLHPPWWRARRHLDGSGEHRACRASSGPTGR